MDPVAAKNAFEELEAAKSALKGQAESFGEDIKATALAQKATGLSEAARIEVATGAIIMLLETKSHDKVAMHRALRAKMASLKSAGLAGRLGAIVETQLDKQLKFS